MAGDGQVTLGHEVLKAGANKLRLLYKDRIIAGFAGSTADAFALFSRFESKLEQYSGNLARSVVELAKEWRMDKMLRNLEAMLVVMDIDHGLIISGNGDVVESDDGQNDAHQREPDARQYQPERHTCPPALAEIDRHDPGDCEHAEHQGDPRRPPPRVIEAPDRPFSRAALDAQQSLDPSWQVSVHGP